MYDENHGETYLKHYAINSSKLFETWGKFLTFSFCKDNIWIRNSDQTSFAGIISIALKHISGEKLGSTVYKTWLNERQTVL